MQSTLLASEVTQSIIGGFFAVHKYFGYGLSEAVYSGAIALELRERGHAIAQEVVVDVRYKSQHAAYQRLDLVVDDLVIIENKTALKIAPADRIQLISYLRATAFELGLLLNFGPTAEFERFIDRPKREKPTGAPARTRA